MKKLLWALCLVLLMIPCLALAEMALPVDETPGYVPNPEAFTETGYEDESISVKMEIIEKDGVQFHVAHVTIQHPSQLRTALAGKYGTTKTNKPSNIANKNNAVVAMNGDYYSKRDYGLVIRQGTFYRKKASKVLDFLAIDENGDFHILPKTDAAQLKELMAEHTIVNGFTFGPALVIDGAVQEMPEKYEFNIHRKEPRSAIGQVGKLSYVLVVADGRTDASEGVKCADLAVFMKEDMQCTQAFALDGGGTATLVYNGEIYNHPKGGERSSSDIIYFATTVDGGFESAEAK